MAITPQSLYNTTRTRRDFINSVTSLTNPTTGNNYTTIEAGDLYETFRRASALSATSRSSGGFFDNFFKFNDNPIINSLNNVTKLTTNLSSLLIESQMGVTTQVDRDLNVMKDVVDIIKRNGLSLNTILQSGSEIIDYVLSQLKEESELRYEINSQTSLTGKLSEKLRNDIILSSINAKQYGFSMREVSEIYTTLVSESGKLNLINGELIDKIIPITSALGINLREMTIYLSSFEKLGYGIEDTLNLLNSSLKNSNQLGISSKKVVSDIQQNIGKLNEYGFKEGIQGLEKMIQKTYEFRGEFNSITSIADKVFNPEGALEFVANLQMIGGAIGDFNDPLRLMYMSTNNIEGLQDALVGAATSLATYNEQQKRFEVTGVNLRRAKEMAQQFGISLGELNKMAIAGSERLMANTELLSTGLNLSDEQKEFLINMSRMRDGKMTLILPKSLSDELGIKETNISLDKITKETVDNLFLMREQIKNMSTEEVAMDQLTETQRMSRDISVVAAYYRVKGSELLKSVGSDLNQTFLGDLKKILSEKKEDVKVNINNKTLNLENTGQKIKENLLEQPKKIYNKIKNNLGLSENNVTPNKIEIHHIIEHKIMSDGPLVDSLANAYLKNPKEIYDIIINSTKDNLTLDNITNNSFV